jgi:hypothetical protein
MNREILQQALDALKAWDALIKYQFSGSSEAMTDMQIVAWHTVDVISALEQELAKPEQEPVANEKEGSPCPEFWDWLPKAYNFVGDGVFTKYNMEVAFLAGKQFSSTAPQELAKPKQEWVGLTSEDWENLPDTGKQGCERDAEIFDWIEAKLKQKNT